MKPSPRPPGLPPALLPVLLALPAAACAPELGPPASLIQGPRILAILSEPPETFPKDPVRLRLYAVTPAGPLGDSDAEVEWSFCTDPKPPVQPNAAPDSCLAASVRPIPGTTLTVTASLPEDACSRFGPEPPPQQGPEIPRPRDPDPTGGYYQPVRARLNGQTALALLRIRCNLARATPQTAAEYRTRYTPNQNPHPLSLTRSPLPSSTSITLRLTLTPDSQETFLTLNPATQALEESQEQLRVSWFTTTGTLSPSTTPATQDSQTTWTPTEESPPSFWAVLRDSRGGSSVLFLPPP
ncbi:MAG: hypothetical protein U1A78_21135 [Polyangia bacterium]